MEGKEGMKGGYDVAELREYDILNRKKWLIKANTMERSNMTDLEMPTEFWNLKACCDFNERF